MPLMALARQLLVADGEEARARPRPTPPPPFPAASPLSDPRLPPPGKNRLRSGALRP